MWESSNSVRFRTQGTGNPDAASLRPQKQRTGKTRLICRTVRHGTALDLIHDMMAVRLFPS
jgi:hypothetical protein